MATFPAAQHAAYVRAHPYISSPETIRFDERCREGHVRVPNYVYDLWLPIIGPHAILVWSTYQRLARDGEVRGHTLLELSRFLRMGTSKLSSINRLLENYGFIRVWNPSHNERRQGERLVITVLPAPNEVPKAMIGVHCPGGSPAFLKKHLFRNERATNASPQSNTPVILGRNSHDLRCTGTGSSGAGSNKQGTPEISKNRVQDHERARKQATGSHEDLAGLPEEVDNLKRRPFVTLTPSKQKLPGLARAQADARRQQRLASAQPPPETLSPLPSSAEQTASPPAPPGIEQRGPDCNADNTQAQRVKRLIPTGKLAPVPNPNLKSCIDYTTPEGYRKAYVAPQGEPIPARVVEHLTRDVLLTYLPVHPGTETSVTLKECFAYNCQRIYDLWHSFYRQGVGARGQGVGPGGGDPLYFTHCAAWQRAIKLLLQHYSPSNVYSALVQARSLNYPMHHPGPLLAKIDLILERKAAPWGYKDALLLRDDPVRQEEIRRFEEKRERYRAEVVAESRKRIDDSPFKPAWWYDEHPEVPKPAWWSDDWMQERTGPNGPNGSNRSVQ